MEDVKTLQKQYEAIKAENLSLNIQRGQPGDENFDVSNPMLTIVDEKDLVTPSGIEIRNYPGGPAGLPEARELFAGALRIKPEETIVGNNSSLAMLVNTLMWAQLKGLKNSTQPWFSQKPKMIVTVPGYDRHFTLLDALGFEMIPVKMVGDGPDVAKIEEIAASDPSVKGLIFVPTYSNPTGDVISDEKVDRLASMKAAAPDFTIFADDAYVVHHLNDTRPEPKNLLRACESAGNANRAYLFGSTSKVTFAGAGLGFMGSTKENVDYIIDLMKTQSIGPNKIEQYRHVKFINSYPGKLAGIMETHAKLLQPKFDKVDEILHRDLDGTGFATWTCPDGGYFISLDTVKPVADRVVALAKEVGVSLTPAGATYPFGKDPHNSNIRIAPTRPKVSEIEKAMEVLCLCVKLASIEYGEK